MAIIILTKAGGSNVIVYAATFVSSGKICANPSIMARR